MCASCTCRSGLVDVIREQKMVKPHLSHAWIFPEAELVLAEAMAGQDLPLVPVPFQSAHL